MDAQLQSLLAGIHQHVKQSSVAYTTREALCICPVQDLARLSLVDARISPELIVLNRK